jgi:2-polyprenyl-3-methyl-5-hydroxy-6-metoxy-1,4-benzoquinol methylase
MNQHEKEIEAGDRFKFGVNWFRFLRLLDEARIKLAEESLKDMLRVEDLSNKRFLDAGSGSGLFSLAARRLGASVYSFDYDPQSVACTQELKCRYFPDDQKWKVEAGSILDTGYLKQLGQFDVVYSWGVLHHTGAMWQALENVIPLIAGEGKLFMAIYNDQGLKSCYWYVVKKTYVKHPLMRWPLVMLHMLYPFLPSLAFRFISGRLKGERGMSFWHDIVDWVGGFPFEVASPEAIFDFYRARGFGLDNLRTTNRSGCNQFVFVKARQT